MSLFVEVDSVEKKAKVIINLDMVVEVAPLAAGGCLVYFSDSAAVNGIRAMKVKEDYSMFKQFAMQQVSTEDITKRIEAINKFAGATQPETEQPKKKAGRPPAPKFDIPKFDGSVTNNDE
jgi:hypothetical protein